MVGLVNTGVYLKKDGKKWIGNIGVIKGERVALFSPMGRYYKVNNKNELTNTYYDKITKKWAICKG